MQRFQCARNRKAKILRTSEDLHFSTSGTGTASRLVAVEIPYATSRRIFDVTRNKQTGSLPARCSRLVSTVACTPWPRRSHHAGGCSISATAVFLWGFGLLLLGRRFRWSILRNLTGFIFGASFPQLISRTRRCFTYCFRLPGWHDLPFQTCSKQTITIHRR